MNSHFSSFEYVLCIKESKGNFYSTKHILYKKFTLTLVGKAFKMCNLQCLFATQSYVIIDKKSHRTS